MLIKAKTFLGTCVSLGDGDAIQNMVHHSRSITLATFRKKIGGAAYWELSDVLGYDRALPGLTLAKDWHVSCGQGKYKGQQVVWLRWSAIEYVYSKEG